jgi:hypothetical protein
MFGGGTADSLGGPKGTVESIFAYFNVFLPTWGNCNAFFTLGLAFLFIWTMPNVLQLFETEQVTVSKIRSTKAFFKFQWSPNIVWAVLLGLMALVDLLMVTGTTEFLYFRL